MRLLLTGAHGQVGFELARSLQPLGEVLAPGRDALDLASVRSIRDAVRDARPDVVVNAAAYTAVDRAEHEREAAMRINGEAPGVLAGACRQAGALLVHYSTDYVFDGSGDAPWPEDARTAPLNVYGASKLAGEQAIAAHGADWLVLRTSWVYGRHGRNFPRTMLRLARERDRLTVVGDQHGAPTSARYIADATAHVVRQAQAERAAGRFRAEALHLVADGDTTWHGIACEVIEGARARGEALRVTEITPIATADYPTPARRPANSRLAHARIRARYGVHAPPWQTGVALLLDDWFGPVHSGR